MLYLLIILILLGLVFLSRIGYVLWLVNSKSHITYVTKSSIKTLIILGSGGHTGEMLKMIKKLDPVRYSPKIFVLASTDMVSLNRLQYMEGLQGETEKEHKVEVIPRTREVGQSWISTIGTTLWASVFSFLVVARHRPSLILANGPGTCVPLCFAAFMLRILGICQNRIVFIESVCRVQSLSLTGRILYRFTDDFFVQWEKLKLKYPKAVYMGRLV